MPSTTAFIRLRSSSLSIQRIVLPAPIRNRPAFEPARSSSQNTCDPTGLNPVTLPVRS
jgi:hypothetical protein